MSKVDERELIKTVFSNDAGRKLLDIWQETIGDRISFHSENTPEQTAYNEGVRSFYMLVKTVFNEETK